MHYNFHFTFFPADMEMHIFNTPKTMSIGNYNRNESSEITSSVKKGKDENINLYNYLLTTFYKESNFSF